MKLVLSEQQLQQGVAHMARQISDFYADCRVTVVGVLTGSIVLLADLIRQIELPLRLGLVQAHSYRGKSVDPGPLAINVESLPDVSQRHVLLVDDIFDTGRTLFELMMQIDELGPASIRSAVLLRKVGRQQVPIVPDWIGFDIPNEFVVGYGLDYDGHYRNLRYLAALDPTELSDREMSA